MKNCIPYAVLAVFAASISAVSAVTYTFPSGTYGSPGTELAGQQGWTINDVGGSDPAGALSYMSTLSGSNAATLGGFYDAPASAPPSTVFVSNAFSGPIDTLSFSTKFAIGQSTEDFPGRDGFGFSFRGPGVFGANVFTISFAPFSNVDEDAYQVGIIAGAAPFSPASDTGGDPGFIFHDGLYDLELQFTPNGLNPTYEFTITGTNATTFTGSADGLGGTSIDRFGAVWDVIDAGDNFIVFDNVVVVPEPSSFALLMLGGLGLFRRRR